MMRADLAKKKEALNIRLNELFLIKKLGVGQFGNVYLVRAKYNGNLYALKCIAKQQVIEQNLEKHFQVKKIQKNDFFMNFF